MATAERMRQRAGAWRKLNDDPTILNMHELAAAMSINMPRLREVLGKPGMVSASRVMSRRRPTSARRHDWHLFAKTRNPNPDSATLDEVAHTIDIDELFQV